MSTVLVVQHVAFEGLGTIADALSQVEGLAEYVRPYLGQPIPRSIDDAAGLVVMGGPMGVYETDRYPFLRDETRLIEDALGKGRPVLGICLGSELLASALGAQVRKAAYKEIGWHRISLTGAALDDKLLSGTESSFAGYHWHGDVFELPSGAEVLASSNATEHQAFRHGDRAYGFLFHMEVTADIVRDMVREGEEELREIGADGDQILEEARAHLPRLRQVGGVAWRRWAAML